MTEVTKVEAARRVKRLLIAEGKVQGVAADEEWDDEELDGLTVDCSVSCDGTWKNRGHESHHCVSSIISVDTGELLDSEYLTNLCV